MERDGDHFSLSTCRLCGWYSTGGKVLATSARSSRELSLPRAPAARPWISTLPTAVASTGPANTAPTRTVRRQLAEQRVLASATDNVDGVDLVIR